MNVVDLMWFEIYESIEIPETKILYNEFEINRISKLVRSCTR